MSLATAYYNEIDPYAAQWLRNLIAAGHIAPGDVDERSIEDVHPDDLKPYTQCHFFAGVGVWSRALRRAGWPDNRPVWTGSCPCQPFSTAGEGLGFDDPRHLWPTFAWLIGELRPAVILGEQVASKAVDAWVDLVHADVEAMAYAFGAIPFPSAGVGAPHIRDRIFWLANLHFDGRNQGRRRKPPAWNDGTERNGTTSRLANGNGNGKGSDRNGARAGDVKRQGVAGGLADASSIGRGPGRNGNHGGYDGPITGANGKGSGLANAERGHASESAGQWPGSGNPQVTGAPGEPQGRSALPDSRPTGPVNGFWGAADWLFCRDGKWRAVEPGTFPLAHGAPSRVGRLRAYGNAINAEQAAEFIAVCMEVLPWTR